MNKRDARREALSNTRTVAELRQLVIARLDRASGMSAVNRAVPLDHALKIYLGALEHRPDNDVPVTTGLQPGRDTLIVTNILRDCA